MIALSIIQQYHQHISGDIVFMLFTQSDGFPQETRHRVWVAGHRVTDPLEELASIETCVETGVTLL